MAYCRTIMAMSLSLVLALIITDYPIAALAAFSGTTSARDLLMADQRAAQCRRAEEERLLLHPEGSVPVQLLEPNFNKQLDNSSEKVSKKRTMGGGFGGGGGRGGGVAPDKLWTRNKALAQEQKHRLHEDGFVRINKALSLEACLLLREHVLHEIGTTAVLYQESCDNDSIAFDVEDYYGIEPGRSCRTDLLLALTSPSVSGALEDLFHAQTGKLRSLYESLVTADGILYEVAAVVTSKGSDRQCIHPDMPFQATASLYVVFLALQDVTTTMGPTTFLRASHTETANTAFEHKGDAFDSLLRASQPFESCLETGDLVVFDARVLHCGTANRSDTDRALFNFSFKSPLVVGDLGYKGSMRPGYTRREIKLGDMLAAIDKKKKISTDLPFALYGNGLS
jgi:hypothetical protein